MDTLGILWQGNNDSSIAALGTGGLNPMFQPLPFDVVKSELNPALRILFGFGVLEADGLQRDGLVLSEAEQKFIMSRIDAFNAAIKNAAASSGLNFHIFDIGCAFEGDPECSRNTR